MWTYNALNLSAVEAIAQFSFDCHAGRTAYAIEQHGNRWLFNLDGMYGCFDLRLSTDPCMWICDPEPFVSDMEMQ